MPAQSSSSAKAGETTLKDEGDTVELARFRHEWLAELQRRKAGTVSGTNTAASTSPDSSQPQSSKRNGSALEATSSQRPVLGHRNLTTHPALDEHGRTTSSSSSKVLESALKIYRRAVVHEQRSELDQALLLYRQAFHLVGGWVSQWSSICLRCL